MKNRKKHLLSMFCGLLILTVSWLGVFTDINHSVDARGLDTQSYSQLIAFDFNENNNVGEKAQNDVDTVLGAGTSDRIEGLTEQTVGNIEQNLGKVSGQAKGLAKQAQGRAKEDIGRTKNAAEDIADKLEDT
ncbi:MAG: CsbD family protein, partial [Cyanobacteria bacterium J06635_10]